jgi:peptide/nickel transport system substrate-binding protein
MRFQSRLKHAISRTATIAIVVVVIVVVASAGVYALISYHPSTQSTSGQIPSSVAVDEIPGPASVDPSTSFDVPGGELMQSVYQPLVFYNGTSVNSFVGILAKNWTASSDGMTYTFNLWSFEKFSDGSPLNASNVWFSFYRTMLMNGGFSHYISQYLDVQTKVSGGGFKGNLTSLGSPIDKETIRLPNGTEQALQSAGYSFTTTNQTTAWEQTTLDLVQILSNFNAANSTIQKVMSYTGQAVVVTGNDQVVMHLMFPFSDFYQTIAGTDGCIVDAAFVDQHGGVQVDATNSYVTSNALGSGPYTLVDPSGLGASFVKLVANPNYWATNIPSGQSNPWLTVPKIGTIVINYQSNEAVRISDIQSGTVQFSQVEVPDLHELSGSTKVTIHNWGPTATVDFASIDAYQYPYNITQVREAIAHGVNATQIQQDVYTGYATSYNGPLDPKMAFYNSSIPGYSFNPNLAVSLLSQTGYKITLPNGTVYNKSGPTLPTLSLIYTAGSVADEEEANIIQAQLQNIGLVVAPTPVAFVTILNDMTLPPNNPSYPAFQIGGNEPVFIGPTDPVVYMTDCPARCGNGDPAYLNNSAVNQLNQLIVQTSNPTLLQEYYNNITLTVQSTYQYVWLDDFSAFTVASSSMQGLYWNVALDGIYYATVT